MEGKLGFEKVISFTPVKFTDEAPPMDGRIVMFHSFEDGASFWVPFLFEDGWWMDFWGGDGDEPSTHDQIARFYTHWAVIPAPGGE